jgi:hypothetical protein
MSSSRLVSFEELYQVFKKVETAIVDRLGQLDQEELLIGLRVAYNLHDSAGKPELLPYSVEFGYLGPVDISMKCDQIDEATANEIWKQTNQSGVSAHPLPRDLLDQLFERVRVELEQMAGQRLRVGIFAVLYGSPIKLYQVSCTCPDNKRRYTVYSRRTKTYYTYCSTIDC